MNRSPSISIVLPVYNMALYLPEALESIAQQEFSDFELIMIDDGSTDLSYSILQNYVTNAKHSCTLIQFDHVGLPACLNAGIRASKAKYIARMDADDVMMPTRLKIQYDYLQSNQEIDILGSWAIEIDTNSLPTNKLTCPQYHNQIVDFLYKGCPLIHPSLLIKKNIFNYGMYKELYPSPEDYDLWIRLRNHAVFHNIPQFLIRKRRHDNSVTESFINSFILNEFKMRVSLCFSEKAYLQLFRLYKFPIKLLMPISVILFIRKIKGIFSSKYYIEEFM